MLQGKRNVFVRAIVMLHVLALAALEKKRQGEAGGKMSGRRGGERRAEGREEGGRRGGKKEKEWSKG